VIDVYWLDAALEKTELELVCGRLLSDPVTQDYTYDSNVKITEEDGLHSIEVAYNAGVADPVEETANESRKKTSASKRLKPSRRQNAILSRENSIAMTWMLYAAAFW
jgi:phosphoribosylformylglycinamidine (FGAM) synthase PurS component